MSGEYTPLLQPQSVYEDRYDRMTIRQCKEKETDAEESKIPAARVITKNNETKTVFVKDKKAWREMLIELSLYYIKGQRAAERDKTIREWMLNDEQRDAIRLKHWQQEAKPDRKCPKCHGRLRLVDKVFGHETGREDHVLSLFQCSSCPFGEALYQDDSQWKRPVPRCAECNEVLDETRKRTKYKIIISQNCPKCSHTDTLEYDLRVTTKPKTHAEIRQELAEAEQFEKDKARYCLSSEETAEYTSHVIGMRNITNMWKEDDEREKYQNYLDKIERLNALDMQKRVTAKLEQVDFQNITYTLPERDRFLTVTFSAYEADPHRQEGYAKSAIRKAIQQALENTNWKLIETSIQVMVGVYSGRIRVLESDKAILEEMTNIQRLKRENH